MTGSDTSRVNYNKSLQTTIFADLLWFCAILEPAVIRGE